MSADYNSGPEGQTQHELVEISAIASRVGRLFRWSPELPYKSKTAWARRGRRLLPGAKPVGFVVTRTGFTYGLTIAQASKMLLAVLDVLDNGNITIVEDGYDVYAYDQTTSKKAGAAISTTNIPNLPLSPLTKTSLSPLSLSSYDSEEEEKTASKSNRDNEIDPVNNGVKKTAEAPNVNSGKPRAVEARGVYFPEDFPWADYPRLRRHEGAVKYILHLLHLRRVIHDIAKDEFVELKMAYLKAIIPEAPLVMRLLLDSGIIERDGHYEPRVKSYGYRIVREDIRDAPRKRIALEDPRLTKRLAEHRKREIKAPVHRWLRDQLYRIGLAEIDETFLRQVAVLSLLEKGRGTIEDKVESYRYALGMVEDGYYHASVDDYGRFHTNITNLKRELRGVLRVSGRPLSEIDIKGSQLLFLGLEMAKEGLDCHDFLGCCQEDVYQIIADKAKASRDQVKKAITQRALFSPNNDPCQKTKAKRVFDNLFPEVAEYLHRAKQVKHGNKLLAQRLQNAESRFVIMTVCDRLRREKGISFITSIHDSLLFLPKDGDYVKGILLEEFAKLGVKPRLEVRSL